MPSRWQARRTVGCAALLALAVVLAFAPVRRNGFVSVDDDLYVTRNPVVLRGLTPDGAAWALRSTVGANWHPLTWLSHMADVSLFGLDPGAHHLASVAMHAGSAVLLLLLLARTTGRLPESAVAAGLFALHPLRVESVAWAAERKDVLVVLLMFVTLLGYTRHAARPSRGRLAVVAALHALACATKPTAVALPALLLVLDFWPLGRHRGIAPGRLLLEKAPLLAVSLAAAAVTYAAQSAGGATDLVGDVPLAARAGNALLATAAYLGTTLLPAGLAVFYPYPDRIPAARAAAAGLLVAGGLALALAGARRRPWLAAGALWFLAALAPAAGIVQAGTQAMADRYAYLPHAGLFAGLVWGAAEPLRRLRAPRVALAAAGAVLLAFAALTARQTLVWRDGETLLRHAVAAVPGNWPARYSLGAHLEQAGRTAEAMAEYRAALAVRPGYGYANSNLGRLLCLEGRLAEAIPLFERAVAESPRTAMFRLNLGLALEAAGRRSEAAACYAEAARLDPADPVARMKAARLPALGDAGEGSPRR